MKVLIFNGTLDRSAQATSAKLSRYVQNVVQTMGAETDVFSLADADIPLFDYALTPVPASVNDMNARFRQADLQVWLTPLYHGSMTGAMKNCLDWLECSAQEALPYLTGKRVALVCWAAGVQAMQGINAMEPVAKALRAWTLPYSLPIQRKDLFDAEGEVSEIYKMRFQQLLSLLITDPFSPKGGIVQDVW